MRLLTNKNLKQKIILALLIVILFNFLVPIRSQAIADVGGDLLKELIKLFVSLGDVVNGIMNKYMLGTSKMYSSAIMTVGDKELTANLEDDESSLAYKVLIRDDDGKVTGTRDPEKDKDTVVEFTKNDLFEASGWFFDKLQVPNIMYCPENIFANKIAMLDVNFLNPNTYSVAQSGDRNNDDAEKASESLVVRGEDEDGQSLRKIISGWYKGFRNIAVVGLLIVLVYIGIRIMISSTSTDKAKYKESLQDWLIALCLIFFMHYIMSGILLVTEKFTEMLNNAIDPAIYVDASKAKENDMLKNDSLKDLKFKTTITGYVRFMVQTDETGDCIAYAIMFFALVIFTLMFTITYVKRFLYIAFFTMIAPLVALTYPIDKIRDGKAQAFNMWFKEYTLNVIIQPVHLLLFTVFIGSSKDLAVANPVYAIIATGFLLPAEKFIKKMFGLEAGTTSKGLGEIAGGALAMKGMSNLVGQFTGKGKKGGNNAQKPGDVARRRGIDPSANTEFVLPDGSVASGAPGIAGAAAGAAMGAAAGGAAAGAGQPIGAGDNGSTNGGGTVDQEPARRIQSPEDIRNDPDNQHRTMAEIWEQERELEDEAATAGYYANLNRETMPEEDKQEMEDLDDEIAAARYYSRLQNADPNREEFIPPPAPSVPLNQPNPSTPPEPPVSIQPPSNPPVQTSSTPSTPAHSPSHPRYTPYRGDTSAIGSQQDPNWRTGLEVAARTRARTIKNTITNPFKKGNRLKTASSVAKTAARIGGAGLGAAALGTVAAGMALTSGDVSQFISTTGAGLSLGAAVGGNIGGSSSGVIIDTINNDMEVARRNSMKSEEYKRRQQAEMDEKWKKDPKNYEYLRRNGFSDKEAKNFLNSNRLADYRKATGIDNIEILQKTMKLVEKENYSDEYGKQIARMVGNTSEKFESAERNSLIENMQKQHGINTETAKKIVKDIATVKGLPAI